MNNSIIATLPIKPQEKTNIGMLIAPTIMDYLGTALETKRIMSINLLNTYHDKDIEANEYVNSINNSFISHDSLFIDKKNADKLLDIVERLYFQNKLKVTSKTVLRCNCGCVDIVYDFINNNAKLYKEIDDKYYCKRCGGICKCYNEKILVFNLDNSYDDTISLTPRFLQKEINGFSKTFRGADILVSKQRNTGYKFKNFNIDVDFLWSNYFNLFEENNQIYIASNHQLFNMYLINYISKVTSNKQLHFIASSYTHGDLKTTLEKFNSKELESYKKLFILYNLKWNSKDCNWSDTVYNYLKKTSDTKLNNLYKSMLIYAKDKLKESNNIDFLIEQVLNKGTNMQENIKLMKTFYKEGKL